MFLISDFPNQKTVSAFGLRGILCVIMATEVSEMEIGNWLRKAVEWSDTTTLIIQEDVCLHLPKLHEFLLQIYETLKHMVSSFLKEITLKYRLSINPQSKFHQTFSLTSVCRLMVLTLRYVSLSKRQIRIKRHSNLFPPFVIYCHGGFSFHSSGLTWIITSIW